MSSPPNTSQPIRSTKHGTASDTSSSDDHEGDITSSARDLEPYTRSTSQQPSEVSEATVLDVLYDGGILDDVSSVTLEDESPCHEADDNKYIQMIPSSIIPTWSEEINTLSLSRSSSDEKEGDSCEGKEDSSDCDSEDNVVPRYPTMEKEMWKAQTDGDDLRCNYSLAGSPSHEFQFDSSHIRIGDWVVDNRPILQDYADRQTSLPLGRRLEVSIGEPPKFILGAIQLLVNRDKRGCIDRSRHLGPQLIENFVDIDRWAKEYFRYQHGMHVIDSDVPALLTIVMNNFYEGQVQLIDRLVDFALEHMRFCGRSNLSIEDFAFGFDFKMSQDLPFYVETSSRIREPLPIPAVEVPPNAASEPVTTASGRQMKPSARAQDASEPVQASTNGRRNKGRNTPQVKEDIHPVKNSVPPVRQKGSSTRPSSRRTEAAGISQEAATTPLKTTTEYVKYRPARSSKLGLPPILPRSPSGSGTTSSQAKESDDSKSRPSSPEESPKASTSSGSSLTVDPPPRLTIRLPPSSLLISTKSAGRSDSVSTKTDDLPSETNSPETTDGGRRALRSARASSRGGQNRDRGQEECGSASLAPDSETSEAKVALTACPAEAGDEEGSAAVNPTVELPTPIFALRKAVWQTSTIQPRGADNSTGPGDDDPSTSHAQRADKPLSPTDPSHPKRKKRKLDDCED